VKHSDLTSTLLLTLLCLISPAASASTWYVNGPNGSNSNNCTSATTPCKTIGRAISLAASGDTIRIAAAIYKGNFTLGKSLNILGAVQARLLSMVEGFAPWSQSPILPPT
jgi:hypothetical protein